MQPLQTDDEKKGYILKNWNVSNGRRITEMLKRYWGSPSNKNAPTTDEQIKDLFGSTPK